MPRVDLTVQRMDYVDGLVPTMTNGDATNHHSFTNTTGSDVFIMVINGGGAPITVTVATPYTLGSGALTVEDRVYTVANGATCLMGPFPSTYFNQSDGKVYVDLSADTSVTLAAIRHGAAN